MKLDFKNAAQAITEGTISFGKTAAAITTLAGGFLATNAISSVVGFDLGKTVVEASHNAALGNCVGLFTYMTFFGVTGTAALMAGNSIPKVRKFYAEALPQNRL